MKTKKSIIVGTRLYMGLCILSLGYVSGLSLVDPQATMDLVNVELGNTDALSSIRGIYGGVGLLVCIWLIHLMMSNLRQGTVFLALFWGLYAFSRLVTWMVDGPLGAFGNQWLIIEFLFATIAVTLFYAQRKTDHEPSFG